MQKRYQWIDFSYKYMTLTLHFNSRDISTVLNILLRDGGKIQAVEELIITNQREWVIWSGAYFQLLNPKTTHVIFKNEYQIQFSWMLASAAVSHVIILATALLPACLYVTVFFLFIFKHHLLPQALQTPLGILWSSPYLTGL